MSEQSARGKRRRRRRVDPHRRRNCKRNSCRSAIVRGRALPSAAHAATDLEINSGSTEAKCRIMSRLPDISIRLDGSLPPRDCVELAVAADRAGFAGVWFAENAFARGIWPAAAACAVATKRIHIHAGVFNPFNRHPTMMAMEIGALDELSIGRASISIGAGIISATGKLGINAEKPLPALRDTITILRGLLNGEEVNHDG